MPPGRRFAGGSIGRRAWWRIAVVLAFGLGLVSFLGAWNPWQLIVFERHPAALLAAFLVSVSAATTLMLWVPWRRWVRRTLGVIAALAGLCAALAVVLVGAVSLMTPFRSVQSEETVEVAEGVSVHRTSWNSRPLHSCVELQVRVGAGWSTRVGRRTKCAENEGTGDWMVSELNGLVMVTRSDGVECTYAVDAASRSLGVVSASGCEALGVQP
jgi:hypothetical protein